MYFKNMILIGKACEIHQPKNMDIQIILCRNEVFSCKCHGPEKYNRRLHNLKAYILSIIILFNSEYFTDFSSLVTL